MSSPFKIATGSYVGNATDNRDITGLGFDPHIVFVKGTGVLASRMRTTSNNAGECLSVVGVQETNNIKSFITDGFRLGTGAGSNQSGTTFRWVAIRVLDSAYCKIGRYTGNGTDNHAITGIGFLPDFVFIKREEFSEPAVFSTTSMKVDVALRTVDIAGVSLNTAIKSLDSDGFNLGTSPKVNTSAKEYLYIAFKRKTGSFNDGKYAGDGTDNRNITGIGFSAKWIINARQDTNDCRQKMDVNVGEVTMTLTAITDIATNEIQSIISDGFQIGSANTVNFTGDSFYWASFGSVNDFTTSLGDSITPSESKSILTGKNASESTSLSDDRNSGISKPLNDSESPSENITNLVTKALTEDVSLNETNNITILLTLLESVPMLEAINAYLVYMISVNDSFNVSDNDIMKSFLKSLENNIFPLDDLMFNVGHNAGDIINTSEDIVKYFNTTYMDSIATTDTFITFAILNQLLDVVGLTSDIFNATIKEMNENIVPDDEISKTIYMNISDLCTTMDDVTAGLLTIYKNLFDSVSMNESDVVMDNKIALNDSLELTAILMHILNVTLNEVLNTVETYNAFKNSVAGGKDDYSRVAKFDDSSLTDESHKGTPVARFG